MIRIFLAFVGILLCTRASWAVDTVQPFGGLNDSAAQAILEYGGAVYVGGFFTSVVDTDGQIVTRNHGAAFDLATGKVLPWNPNTNGSYINTLAEDGGLIYAGGSFTTVNGGISRSGIAAFDAVSGTVQAFNPGASGACMKIGIVGTRIYYIGNGFIRCANLPGGGVSWTASVSNVMALAADSNGVYIGGYFTTVLGQPRSYLAALNPLSGALLPWDPVANNWVYDLHSFNGQIWAGGLFTMINTTLPILRLAAIDPVSGAAAPFSANIQDGQVTHIDAYGNTLLITGNFQNISGQAHPWSARLAISDGNPINPGFGTVFNSTNGCHIGPGGIFISGFFPTCMGVPVRKLAVIQDAPLWTNTITPSATPSFTTSPTPTVSASMSPTITPTCTPTATPTDSPTSSATPTATPTDSPTSSATPTATPTDSPTSSATPTATMTDSPTSSATPSATLTDSPTSSATPSATPTESLTLAATVTDTPTFPVSPTLSVTLTASLSPAVSPTFTVILSQAALPAATATPPPRLSGLGKTVLAPVPARGEPLCLWFREALASSEWDVFNVAAERVAHLKFGGEADQCWAHAGAAPGIYLVRLKVTYQSGREETFTQKAVLLEK